MRAFRALIAWSSQFSSRLMAATANVGSSAPLGRLTAAMSRGSLPRGLRGNPLEALAEQQLAGAPPKVRRPDVELHPVALVEAVGQWPVGTTGTVVDAFEDEAVIEVSAPGDGATLGLLTLPYSAFSLLPRPSRSRLAI